MWLSRRNIQTEAAELPSVSCQGSGDARVPEMATGNIPVCLAVDGSASDDGSNLLEEICACYLLHRLNFCSKVLSGYDVLKPATRGGPRLAAVHLDLHMK